MYICKAAVICNKCGAKAETKSLGRDPFASAFDDNPLREAGWISTGVDVHLCPDCAAPYNAKKKEMEEELRRLSGVRTIEFDI